MATQYTAGLTSGQVLTAATMNSIGAAWETYTPTWTSSGTAPALGNGTLTGRYCRINKTIVVQIALTTGSTSTYGTGSYYLSLPFTNTTNTSIFFPLGFGYIQDTSTGTVYTCIGHRANTADKIGFKYSAGGFGDIGATAPFTFASTDGIFINCTYEYS
jgi:hypothetical protein